MFREQNFLKTGAHFSFETKFARIYNFGSRSSIQNWHVPFALTPNFIKIEAHFSFGNKFRKLVILDQGHQFQLIY